MKVVLLERVENLGAIGDVVSVKDGFARNYLVPKGLAFIATPGAATQAASMRRSRDVKDAAARSAAQEVASKLVPTVIAISAKAGGEGKLFGSVTTAEVVEAVAAQTGVELVTRECCATPPRWWRRRIRPVPWRPRWREPTFAMEPVPVGPRPWSWVARHGL